jgi:hypothetical protein
MRRALALERFDLFFRQQSFQPADSEGAADRLLVEHEVADFSLLQKRHELTVGHRLGVGREEQGLRQ